MLKQVLTMLFVLHPPDILSKAELQHRMRPATVSVGRGSASGTVQRAGFNYVHQLLCTIHYNNSAKKICVLECVFYFVSMMQDMAMTNDLFTT